VVGLFVLPPSRAALEARLTGRGDAPAVVADRMARAADEMSHAPEFDHVIVNDDFAASLANIRAVLAAARVARPRLTGLDDFLGRLCRA
jgi:guanylate kinase